MLQTRHSMGPIPDPGIRAETQRAYLLLLLPDDFFSPAWLLRLLALLLPRARSLWASLFWLLALAPLLALSERPLLPAEDFELRDAIDISFK
jgi:hypothetical protein